MIPTKLALVPSSAANYPRMYETARAALTQCLEVDEVQEWISKAAAIEAYARQSKDDTLVIMAQRIQARAIRRAGELLKQIPACHYTRKGPSRLATAQAAGMSRQQFCQASAIAQIPTEQFESLVESEKPPKAYKLHEIGLRKRTTRTKKSLERSLELARDQVVRAQARLEAAIAKVSSISARIARLTTSQEKVSP